MSMFKKQNWRYRLVNMKACMAYVALLLALASSAVAFPLSELQDTYDFVNHALPSLRILLTHHHR